MAQPYFIIAYSIDFISMLLALFTALKLYINGTNYIIAVLAAAMSFGEFIIFLSVIWINDLKAMPKGVCVFQGLALQYALYLQVVAAVCFSFHIYQLLVRYKQGMSSKLQKFYIGVMVVAPLTMTIVATIVTLEYDVVKLLGINCDIKGPVWARLIGYSGFNLALTIPGVYLSARAAYQVFRHLDRFKDKLTSAGNDSQDSMTAINARNTSSPEIQIYVESTNTDATASTDAITSTNTATSFGRSRTQSRVSRIKAIKSYNMTKAAAIRMVLFSCGFAFINVIASFQTISMILKEGILGKHEITTGVAGNDLIGILLGTLVFLVFGLPNSVKKCFSRRRY